MLGAVLPHGLAPGFPFEDDAGEIQVLPDCAADVGADVTVALALVAVLVVPAEMPDALVEVPHPDVLAAVPVSLGVGAAQRVIRVSEEVGLEKRGGFFGVGVAALMRWDAASLFLLAPTLDHGIAWPLELLNALNALLDALVHQDSGCVLSHCV